MMGDEITITPHVVERWADADRVEMASVPSEGTEDGEAALLVFASEAAAETFRSETGRYPASEGFEVVYVDVDGLRNMVRTWGFRNLAVVGLEPDGGADTFDAEGFCEMLEGVE